MVQAKLIGFNPTTNALADVNSNATAASIIVITRPRAATPAFMLFVSSTGELRVFTKQGILAWVNDTGVGGISDASINQNGEVLTRAGTTIRFYSSSGALVWTQTVTNLTAAKVGTSSVACLIIITGDAVNSGVQWRSKANGSLIQGVYGTVTGPNNTISNLQAGSTGDITAIIYHNAGSNTVERVETHSRTAGRTGSVTTNVATGEGGFGPTGVFVDCNQDVSIIAVCGDIPATSTSSFARIFDGSLLLLGSSTVVRGPQGIAVNPVGNKVIHWAMNGSFISGSIFNLISTVPFSLVGLAAAVGFEFVAPTRFACDVSEDAVFFVSDNNQRIRVYEDSITQTVQTVAQGVANMMTAVIRDA